MEREPGKKFEGGVEDEKYGANVTIHAVFMRHGEKELSTDTFETGLSEVGRRQSEEFGKARDKRSAVKSYSSETDRTEETGRLAIDSSPTEKKMRHVIRKELAFDYDPDGEFAQTLMAMKKEMLGADYGDLGEDEKQRRMLSFNQAATDYYLSFGEERPDPETNSPVELAAKIAKRVDRYSRMPDKLKSGSDVDLINATHDFPVASFLKETMIRVDEGERRRGFESVAEIGGPIKPTDHFEVTVRTDETGERTMSLLFRGDEYSVDEQRLGELVEIAEDMETDKDG